MSFTRFHDDDARIKKQLQESTFAGRYQLNAPGPGENLPFIEDPHMRLEKWGANNRTNGVDLESDLKTSIYKNRYTQVRDCLLSELLERLFL